MISPLHRYPDSPSTSGCKQSPTWLTICHRPRCLLGCYRNKVMHTEAIIVAGALGSAGVVKATTVMLRQRRLSGQEDHEDTDAEEEP